MMDLWRRTLGVGAAVVLCASSYPGKSLGEQLDDAPLLNPLGPVSASTKEVLERRQPLSDLDGPSTYWLAGKEPLAPDEMRIIALGSNSTRIQASQASPCWMVELGNGDVFLFDMGPRCTVGLSMMEVPWDTFTKIFLTHLHADHIGDLPTLLAGGWDMGRSLPLDVWGPSGTSPDLGTRAMVEHLLGMYRWEFVSKLGRGGMSAYSIRVHEFDYAQEQVLYERNDVTIRSWPALHTIDGPVSYSLEWNGMKFAYSGDTVQNKWFIKNAMNADIVVHECSAGLKDLIEEWGFPPEAAWTILKTSHTQARQAAEVFSLVNTRMAVCTHYPTDDIDKSDRLYEEIKRNYQGPFMLAKDRLTWTLTPDTMRVSMMVGGSFASDRLPRAQETPERDKITEPSAWLKAGEEPMAEIAREQLQSLKPEDRARILERVDKELLPPQ